MRLHPINAALAGLSLSAAVVAGATVAPVGHLLADAVRVPVAGAQEAPEAPAAPEMVPSDNLAALMEDLSKVAHEVSAKNEELKTAEDDLARLEGELRGAQEHADRMRAAADVATGNVVTQQAAVDGIAASRYRGLHMDTLTTTLASGSPQEAVERLGYMGALSRDAHRNLTSLSKTSAEADKAKREAADAVTVVEDKKRGVEERRVALVAERDALNERQRDIESRVDALDAVERAAWENQFHPGARIDLSALAGTLPSGLGGGAVAAALSQQGAPYGWGMAGPSQFDCSGLMYWSYQQQGKTIPRTSQAQIAGGTPVPLDQLQPGDIVGYYAGITHVGMYIGNGQVVHASTYGVPVQVVPVDSMPIQAAARY